MLSHIVAEQSLLSVQWPAQGAARLPRLAAASDDALRQRWLSAFVARLGELRPTEDDDTLLAVAADLWDDVGGHDPYIAAEIEYESSLAID